MKSNGFSKIKNDKPNNQYRRLQEIFKSQQLLGWDILDRQSTLYTQTNTTLENITALTSLYMKVIQGLNAIQDPRESYFNLKMQKLMAQPYVIRCFNSNTQTDSNKNNLQSRRKQLELQVQKQVERQNHKKVVQQVIIAQQEKQKKMISKVKQFVDQSNKKLQARIKKRTQAIQMRNSIIHSSQFIASQGSDYSLSPPRRSTHNYKIQKFLSSGRSNSTFQMQISQQDYFSLKRQIQEQQQQQKFQRKLNRQKSLNPFKK